MADEGFGSVILQGPACGPHVAYLSPEAVKLAAAEAVAAERARCVQKLGELAAWHALQSQKSGTHTGRVYYMIRASALAEAVEAIGGDPKTAGV